MALTQISTEGIKNGTISTADLADESVTLAKLLHGTSSNDGKFLRANNGADPTFETVNTDLVADTSPQLGGNLDCNGNNIHIDDGNKLHIGNLTSNTGDLQLHHVPADTFSYIDTFHNLAIRKDNGAETHARFMNNGAVELYYDNSLKFETIASGTRTTGAVHVNDGSASGNRLSVGNGGDLKIYHTNPNSYIDDDSSALSISSQRIDLVSDDGENMARFYKDAQVELYYDNSKKLQTDSDGVEIFGNRLRLADNVKAAFGSGADLQIYHDGSHSYIYDNGTGKLRLLTNSFRVYETDNATNMISADASGAVELYYDGSKKFETTSTGYTVTGDIRFGGTGTWTGEADQGKIQNYGGIVYIQGGNNATYGIVLRDNGGTDRVAVTQDGHLVPAVNNTYDLGTTSLRWRNIYTNDLNLSNEGGSNDVDGTWGSFTIQEGAEDLFLVNRRNGKKYKFNLTEVA